MQAAHFGAARSWDYLSAISAILALPYSVGSDGGFPDLPLSSPAINYVSLEIPCIKMLRILIYLEWLLFL